MKRRNWCFPLFLFLGMLLFFPYPSWPQLIIGQYEDEAPFRTWNTLGIQTASSLAMGGTHFSLASDCSVALSNPALLAELPKVTFTLNSSLNQASFFKYSFVNTGILNSDESIYHRFYAFDFAGISLRLDNWAFALSWAQIENYDRPISKMQYRPEDRLYYFINLDQSGSLKNMNFSISRKLTQRLYIGLGFNYVYGHLKKDITEEWVLDEITITDNKSQEYTGFYLNGGLSIELAQRLKVALVFRTPYFKKSESQSLLRYYAATGGTEIKIEAFSDDKYKQPFVIGLGASYRISGKLIVASDFAFFNWSGYSVDYFEEPLRRNFKDVIKIGAGVEYIDSFRFLNQDFDSFLRGGLSYDPQPMKEPHSFYIYLTLGSGLRWKKFLLDGGALLGREKGSGDSLKAQKIAFSLSYRF